MAEKIKPRLKVEYVEKMRKDLLKELNLDNIHRVPHLVKIVINTGLGDALEDKTVLDTVSSELARITGQKPVATLSKKAIAGFKIRKGDAIGMKVTLRGDRMWEFFDKLINVVFPRTKDFRGLSSKSFDKVGNYTFGIEEQSVFPEIDANSVTKIRGMEVTLVMGSESAKHSKLLLDKFGFPFVRDGEKV